MMRIFVISCLALINFVAQSTVFGYIEIGGIKPNTGIALIVSYTLLRGGYEGAALGFGIGLLQDIFYGDAIGYYGLIGMYIGLLCGGPTKNFFRENFFLPLAFTALCTFLAGMFTLLTGFLFRGHLNLLFFIRTIVIPETIYTTLAGIIIYRILYTVNYRIELYEVKRRKMF